MTTTLRDNATTTAFVPIEARRNAPQAKGVPLPLGTEQKMRIGAYSMLAALLRDVPTPPVLAHVASTLGTLEANDETAVALNALAGRAASADHARITNEFNALFIGIGRGELVPYGSWYLTGFLMEKPLALLRNDLAALGFERQEHITEPEDHIAALCEVMSMLIGDQHAHEGQQLFFEQHMASWMGRFFADLQQANAADFYRTVGRFGSAFTELESRYFAMRL